MQITCTKYFYPVTWSSTMSKKNIRSQIYLRLAICNLSYLQKRINLRYLSHEILQCLINQIMFCQRKLSSIESKYCSHDLRSILLSYCAGVVVSLKPFGSFLSDLYTKWGDLDVSVQIDNTPPDGISRNMKRNYLRQIMQALRKTGTQYTSFLRP